MTAVLTTLIHFLRRSSIIGLGLLVVIVLGILSLATETHCSSY